MPTYSFEHPITKEIVDIEQSMSEEHTYIDDEGIKWIRLFYSPQTSIKDEKIDLNSPKDRNKYNSVYKKRYEYNKKKGKIGPDGKIR